MARQVKIIVIDDLDENTTADETIPFALDGTTYEIDLSLGHAKELRETLSRFTAAARKVGRDTTARKGDRSRRGHRDRSMHIREWARDNRYTLSERGRIPAHIIAAYDATH